MSRSVVILPDNQLAPLLRAYADAVARKRLWSVAALLVFCGCVALACYPAQIDPSTFWRKLGGFSSYFDRILTLDDGRRVWTNPGEWFWGLQKWLSLMAETLLIAYVATVLGVLGAFVLCFVATASLSRAPVSAFVAKRFLEICRTVPELVFALVFVVAFGLGPLPGVLALAIHTMGALGKLFCEAVESVDLKPVDGLRSLGASFASLIRFAVLPQVLASFAGYSLLRFEVNVRGASVMGFVGAGGIGQELLIAVRKFYYSDVSAILVLIIVTVFAIDILTGRLRGLLVDLEGAR